jgi:hypothetical protein
MMFDASPEVPKPSIQSSELCCNPKSYLSSKGSGLSAIGVVTTSEHKRLHAMGPRTHSCVLVRRTSPRRPPSCARHRLQ